MKNTIRTFLWAGLFLVLSACVVILAVELYLGLDRLILYILRK